MRFQGQTGFIIKFWISGIASELGHQLPHTLEETAKNLTRSKLQSTSESHGVIPSEPSRLEDSGGFWRTYEFGGCHLLTMMIFFFSIAALLTTVAVKFLLDKSKRDQLLLSYYKKATNHNTQPNKTSDKGEQ